jgi:hypothetical protein
LRATRRVPHEGPRPRLRTHAVALKGKCTAARLLRASRVWPRARRSCGIARMACRQKKRDKWRCDFRISAALQKEFPPGLRMLRAGCRFRGCRTRYIFPHVPLHYWRKYASISKLLACRRCTLNLYGKRMSVRRFLTCGCKRRARPELRASAHSPCAHHRTFLSHTALKDCHPFSRAPSPRVRP